MQPAASRSACASARSAHSTARWLSPPAKSYPPHFLVQVRQLDVLGVPSEECQASLAASEGTLAIPGVPVQPPDLAVHARLSRPVPHRLVGPTAPPRSAPTPSHAGL